MDVGTMCIVSTNAVRLWISILDTRHATLPFGVNPSASPRHIRPSEAGVANRIASLFSILQDNGDNIGVFMRAKGSV